MSESEKPGRSADGAEEDTDFLQRWSQRKAQARARSLPEAQQELEVSAEGAQTAPPAEQPGDEDMPPLESLDQDSDYSGFLSPRVSEELRRLALRKLFHGPKFNVTDGMDDYAQDYSKMEPLGDIVTADMRFHMERAKERLAEAERQLERLSGDHPDQARTQAAGGADKPVEIAGTAEGASNSRAAGEPEDQEKEDEPGAT